MIKGRMKWRIIYSEFMYCFVSYWVVEISKGCTLFRPPAHQMVIVSTDFQMVTCI